MSAASKVKIQRSFDETVVRALVASGIKPTLARVLAARGITHIGQLETTLGGLIPPEQLTHNVEMARLLADAIEQKKKLLIIGDYDADGATATAVAMRGLTSMGARVDFLVPNRFEYGYGLTPEIVALAATRQPDMIITVDNGIASVEGVHAANVLGICVLVTDHHLPGTEMPEAACILNPNQTNCSFPSKNLAGVGVIFMPCWLCAPSCAAVVFYRQAGTQFDGTAGFGGTGHRSRSGQAG